MFDQYINSAEDDTKRAFAATSAVLEYLSVAFNRYNASGYNDTAFLSGLDTLSTVYGIYRQVPDLVEAVVITSLSAPDKVKLHKHSIFTTTQLLVTCKSSLKLKLSTVLSRVVCSICLSIIANLFLD